MMPYCWQGPVRSHHILLYRYQRRIERLCHDTMQASSVLHAWYHDCHVRCLTWHRDPVETCKGRCLIGPQLNATSALSHTDEVQDGVKSGTHDLGMGAFAQMAGRFTYDCCCIPSLP